MDAIPTTFGRLVYLRTLPDSTELPVDFAALQVFCSWLSLGTNGQLRDLRAYIADCGGSVPADCARLVPPGARDVEGRLFLTDVETVLGLLSPERI
jgi:hypothetical protein